MDETIRLAAEALAAATGIQRILDVPARPITKTDGRKAARLGKEIEGMLREFLATPSFKGHGELPPQPDYFETLEKLTRPVQQEQREALLTNIEDESVGLAYLDVCDKGVAWLLERLPRRSRPTLVGDIPVEPSLPELADFDRDWAMALDPLQALRDMAAGIMISAQVDAFRALFPLLYQRTAMAFQGAMLDMRGKDEEWEPPLKKSWQAFTFFGISPVDPGLAGKLQEQSKKAAAAEEQNQALGIDISTPDASTPTQRLANE